MSNPTLIKPNLTGRYRISKLPCFGFITNIKKKKTNKGNLKLYRSTRICPLDKRISDLKNIENIRFQTFCFITNKVLRVFFFLNREYLFKEMYNFSFVANDYYISIIHNIMFCLLVIKFVSKMITIFICFQIRPAILFVYITMCINYNIAFNKIMEIVLFFCLFLLLSL